MSNQNSSDSPLRRSARIAAAVLIEVQGDGFAHAGEAVKVNLHGALIRTAASLELGSPITIHVPRTGKSAHGRIVFASYENSPHYGIELDRPDNIWGLRDVPEDWKNGSSSVLS